LWYIQCCAKLVQKIGKSVYGSFRVKNAISPYAQLSTISSPQAVYCTKLLYDAVYYQFLRTAFTLPPISNSTLSYPCFMSTIFVNATLSAHSAVCLSYGLASLNYAVAVAIFLTVVRTKLSEA
jgi:hypothetical protein